MTSAAPSHFRASLRGLETAGRTNLLRLHIRTQAVRFARVAVLAFAAQAAALGVHDWTWQALASLGLGAAETAARQLWPALPTAELGTLLRLGHLIPEAHAAPTSPAPADSHPADPSPATSASAPVGPITAAGPSPTPTTDVSSPQPPSSGQPTTP
jgi:hypothetical protein